MSILVDKNTKVICQGITGSAGSFHTDQCLLYGTQFVGGVTPEEGGTDLDRQGVRQDAAGVQHRRRGGRRRPGPTPRMIFVPPAGAADAIMEAADAGIRVIVAITEGIPVLDMARAKRFVPVEARRAADRPELPRRHHAGPVQDRHHARLHPQAGEPGAGSASSAAPAR